MFQSWPRCWHSAMTSDTQVGISCNSCPFYVFSFCMFHLNFSYQVSSQLLLSLMLSFSSFLSKALNLLDFFFLLATYFPILLDPKKSYLLLHHLPISPLLPHPSCPVLCTPLSYSPLVIPLKTELSYKILERGRMRFWLQAEEISSNVTYKFFANNKELSGADVRHTLVFRTKKQLR